VIETFCACGEARCPVVGAAEAEKPLKTAAAAANPVAASNLTRSIFLTSPDTYLSGSSPDT
jgi:hypothetical protein